MERTNKRKDNVEVLRVVSMLLICIHHYIYDGLKLSPLHNTYEVNSLLGGVNFFTMEPLWVLTCVAVNCYVMITGYFLVERTEFRWKGIFQTLIITLFYSILFLVIAMVCDWNESRKEIFKAILPIHQKEYWFVTTYIGLLIIAPFLSILAKSLSQKQYQILLMVLFFLTFQFLYGRVYAGFQTINWFTFLYLLAGYIRLFGLGEKLERNPGKITIAILLLLSIAACFVNCVRDYNWQWQLISSAYDGPMIFLSVAFFMFFLKYKPHRMLGNFCIYIAPFTFAVYLIHTNPFIMKVLWEMIIPETYTTPQILHCLICSILIFFICITIDYIRNLVFKLVGLEFILGRISACMPKLNKFTTKENSR